MKKTIKLTVIVLLLATLAAVFGYSLYQVIDQLREEKQAKDQYDALAESVRQIENQTAAEPTEEIIIKRPAENARPAPIDSPAASAAPSDVAVPEPEPEKRILPQYAALYEQNPDLFGWIRIEGTPIDYPVMYTPNDSEYYLHRDFYGKERNSGSLFIDGACPADGNFYLIYGHSMKNKTMFGTLKEYADRSYWEEHKTVQFDTLYEKRTYIVIAAFYSKVYSDGQTGVFQYYDYRDLSDPSVFETYVANVLAASLYDTGVDAEYGDELIALSTCYKQVKNGRFVIVAKRVS